MLQLGLGRLQACPQAGHQPEEAPQQQQDLPRVLCGTTS